MSENTSLQKQKKLPVFVKNNNKITKIESLDEYFEKRIKEEMSKKLLTSPMSKVNNDFNFLQKIEGFDKSDIIFNKRMLYHQNKFGRGKIKSECFFENRENNPFSSPLNLLSAEIQVYIIIKCSIF